MTHTGNLAADSAQRLNGHVRLHGSIPPVITPLHSDGSLDRTSLERLLRRMLDAGVHGVFMLGTAGEGAMLPPGTSHAVVQATCSYIAGQVPVLAGVIEPSPIRAIENARAAVEAGAAAIVVAAPYYFQHDDAAALHIGSVIAAVDAPIVLYNIPQLTRNKIRIEDVELYADRIVAIKDSSADLDHVSRLLQIPGLRLFQGAEPQMAAALKLGAAGVVAGLANLAPRLFVDLYTAAAAGDFTTADTLQTTIIELRTYNKSGYWLAALKTALSLTGCAQPYTAFPVPPIDDEGKRHMRTVLERHGLL